MHHVGQCMLLHSIRQNNTFIVCVTSCTLMLGLRAALALTVDFMVHTQSMQQMSQMLRYVSCLVSLMLDVHKICHVLNIYMCKHPVRGECMANCSNMHNIVFRPSFKCSRT